MARIVMILGESGSGKSASLRNFEPEEVSIFSVAGKIPPFRKKLPLKRYAGYQDIFGLLQKANSSGTLKPCYVIDDSQYLMAFQSFGMANQAGYGKFTDMAVSFYNLLQFCLRELPDSTTVYFLHHTEVNENGNVKAKTIGKMLDNQLTIEGLFETVLLCRTDGQRHWFETQSDGHTSAKSPMDMFPDREIDNDLKMVDQTIRAYYAEDGEENKGETA